MEFQDKTLTCKECGKEFIWTAGEQKFFSDKGLTNQPSRCPDCRKNRKSNDRSGRGRSDETYTIKCKQCGKMGEVPFRPRDPENVLCADCFKAEKQKLYEKRDAAAETPAPEENTEEAAESTEE